MSGNEILLNMQNAEHFRDSELINSINELSKRAVLDENKDISILCYLIKKSDGFLIPILKILLIKSKEK